MGNCRVSSSGDYNTCTKQGVLLKSLRLSVMKAFILKTERRVSAYLVRLPRLSDGTEESQASGTNAQKRKSEEAGWGLGNRRS